MKKLDFNTNWICNGTGVTLPHDAQITELRSKDTSNCGHGYFPGGVYTYEKTFTMQKEWQGKTLIVEFEGVYKNATVSLNGKKLAFHPYGYTDFFVELDNLVSGENKLTVVADNSMLPNSRWYSGSGIYRPVWLYICEPNGIRPQSVRINTLSINPAIVRVASPVDGMVTIYDGEMLIASGEGKVVELTIPSAKLWSDKTPYLYRAVVMDGADVWEERFGIRKIEWSNKGLFINGKETLLRGGCVHHDHGILGAATYDESEYRRVRILKEAGFNAIRSAHNPTSRALLDACDKLGMYVMDEAWDMWFHHKSRYDYASLWREHFADDLKAIVRRDHNHPSVLMYSIGNEVSEPAKPEGVERAKQMVALLHELDPDRAVTAGINLTILTQSAGGKYTWDPETGGKSSDGGEQAAKGMNSTLFNLITSIVGTGMNKAANSKKADRVTSPVLDALDIAGYNYASGRYPLEAKAHPNRIVVGSETFPQDLPKNWAMVQQYPYLIGDFMWTAWDYIGEAGIGAWAYTPDGKGFDKPYPWLLADTGAFDILGDPTGEALWASAVWSKGMHVAVQPINHDKKPAKAVWRGTNAIPSWSWKGCEGKRAVVEVYADAARVELFLNGKPLTKAKVKDCRAVLKVIYAPGKLEAVAYDASGRECGRECLASAKGASLQIASEAETVRPGGIVYVPVCVADASGIVESNDDREVTVTVENGELLGFGSANPRTEERFGAGRYTTYYGHALAVVRAGQAGSVTVTASDQFGNAQIAIPIQ